MKYPPLSASVTDNLQDHAALGGASRPRLLLWIARITAIAAIVPVMMIAFGEYGRGPEGPREWIYLALFPFVFSAGYLLAWRWPLLGGSMSLACMFLSQIVIGRIFPWSAYLIWGVLCLPAIFYVVAGITRRRFSADRTSTST